MVWAPGQSGNPRGRPPADHGPVVQFARAHTQEAIATLAAIMRSGCSEAARIAACNVLLDRGWGKAREHQDLRLNYNVRDLSDEELLAIINNSAREQLPAPLEPEKV